jgi:hypothetical protein
MMSTTPVLRAAPRLAARIQARYPSLRVECTGTYTAGVLWQVNVRIQGTRAELLASDLVESRHFEKDSRGNSVSHRTEYGDRFIVSDVDCRDGCWGLYIYTAVDSPPDEELPSGVPEHGTPEMQRLVAGMLERAFALPRRA